MLSETKARTARSIYYLGVAQMTVFMLTLGMVAVLTRLLTPEDFGIVGLAMIVMALFVTIQDFGIAPAVIQRDTRIREAIGVGLSLRWIIASIIVVLLALFSPFIAEFYGNKEIGPVLLVMSINLLIQPLAFSSYVTLNRKLMFNQLAIATVVNSVTLITVAIVLAVFQFSYWSIVFGSLTGNVMYVVVINYYGRVVCKPILDKALTKELLGFGSHLLVGGLMGYVLYNVDQFIVGKVLGIAVLGIYFISVKVGRTLGEQMSGVVNRVLLPTMSRMKDSLRHLKIGYVESLRMIAIVAVPLTVGLSALAPIFVEVVLGEGYEAASVPIAILSFQGLLGALISPVSSVLISIGKPKYLSIQTVFRAGLMAAFIYPVTLHFGLNGVCVLTTVLSLSALVYYLFVSSKVFATRLTDIVEPMAPSLYAGLVTYIVLLVSAQLVSHSILSLSLLALAGASIYLAAVYRFSRGKDVQDVILLVRNSLNRN